MTFGTETIPKVSKIFGPGNQFVTVAKQLATKFGVAIDMPVDVRSERNFGDESGEEAKATSSKYEGVFSLQITMKAPDRV